MHSLADTHNDINEEFMALEEKITYLGTTKLKAVGVNPTNLIEKVHLAMDMVQSFAHEYLYDNHEYIDYDAMRKDVKKCLLALFSD